MIARFDVVDGLSRETILGQDDALAVATPKNGDGDKQVASDVARKIRSEWSAVYGSPYLKKADAAGYHCQRIYVEERVALEYPGYVVDFGDKCNWRQRACPSEGALDKALADGGEVVWLTQVGPGLKIAFQGQCEAVVVRQYLGKYNLVTVLI